MDGTRFVPLTIVIHGCRMIPDHFRSERVRFYLSSMTATISWSVHDKSSRYETTKDSSNRWNSRVTVMTFSCLFFSARSGSMLFVEKLSWRRRCCFWPSFAKYDSPRLHLFDIGRITSIPSRSPGGILREQISMNGELEKWDDLCSVTGQITSLLTSFESTLTERRRHES